MKMKSFKEKVSKATQESIDNTHPSPGPQIDLLEIAIQEGWQKRRCFGYNPTVKAVLAYLSLTKPRFNESEKVVEHVAAGLAQKYPKIWSAVSEAMKTRHPNP